MARSRRTPAMLVGRCSSELSSHKLQAKSKKSTSSERSAARIYRITDGLWRVAEGTPAMLVGRCSSQFSSHRLQAKSKKSQAPSEAEGSAVFLRAYSHPLLRASR